MLNLVRFIIVQSLMLHIRCHLWVSSIRGRENNVILWEFWELSYTCNYYLISKFQVQYLLHYRKAIPTLYQQQWQIMLRLLVWVQLVFFKFTAESFDITQELKNNHSIFACVKRASFL